MKPKFGEFCCPQCGELPQINVNGICFDCSNENTLRAIAERRKIQQKLNNCFQALNVESYN